MTVILFIAVLLVTVLVHEWGHYIAAKKSGMMVEEFGFGIPPKIWSWKKGETEYSINALPIGGFVKIAGENGAESGVAPERQFDSKPWYKKTIVLVAGVVCNFVLAVVLFSVGYLIGLPGVVPDGKPTVVSIAAGSPISQSTIAVGDTIREIRVGSAQAKTLDTEHIRELLSTTTGDISIAYTTKQGEESATTITPTTDRHIGVAIEPIGTIKQPLDKAVTLAWHQSVDLVVTIFRTIGGLIVGLIQGNGSAAGLIGPVGLAKEVGSAATIGFAYLLAFVATISINLAVLNILPFPALDGGRLIVVWAEAITKRRFSPKVVGIIHAAGFLVLIGLMIVLTIGDIRKAV